MRKRIDMSALAERMSNLPAGTYESGTHFVRGTDYEVGDLVYSSGASYRVQRFEPYTHPVPEVAERCGALTRIAYCEAGFAITMTEHGAWPMEWDKTPPKYRARFHARNADTVTPTPEA